MLPLTSLGKSGFFPVFVMSSFGLTLLAGLLGTVLPSLDYLPVIGHTRFSLSPWQAFFVYPGIWTSIRVTLISGITASVSAVGLSVVWVCRAHGSRSWRLFEKALSPLLSLPHAAFAIGFGFLIAPSGWFIRMISPGLTGFSSPPDWILLNDPYGLSLAAALAIKEIPFLVMVMISAMGQLDMEKTLLAGRALGYTKEQIWLKILMPRLYPHIRLSVFAVIAYSFSVVDMALILGPGSPPTLAVQILKWFNDPDLSLKPVAACGSLFLFALAGLGIFAAYLMEKALGVCLTPWVVNGRRRSILTWLKPAFFLPGPGILFFTGMSTLLLVIWSFTRQWQFPDALPASWSLKFWEKGLVSSFHPLMTTLLTGAASAFAGLILTIGCLEHEAGSKRKGTRNLSGLVFYFLYLPLLVPQISFMAGIQLLLVVMKLDGLWITLFWSHLVFVLPYLFIVLRTTYLSYDGRFSDQAMLLGKSYPMAFLRIKLPMLFRPLLFSLAVGFSVSVAQYIPTMLVGAGRFSTLTTEAVAIASGSDRRAMAVYALIQQGLPLIIYALALLAPKILYYNRKGMQV
jgi:putative thiamine transport system permease protein